MLPRSQRLCWSCRISLQSTSLRSAPTRCYATVEKQLDTPTIPPPSIPSDLPDQLRSLAEADIQQSQRFEPDNEDNPNPSQRDRFPPEVRDELERLHGEAEFQQSRLSTGLVVSAGKMARTVKVRLGGIVKDKKLRTEFKQPAVHMVHDPTDILVEGDVVRIASGWRSSKMKRHVVVDVVAAYGTRIEERVGWAEGGGRLAKDGAPDHVPGVKGIGLKTREEMLLAAEKAREEKWNRSARGMIKLPRSMLAKKMREGSLVVGNGRVMKRAEREQILVGYRKIWEKDPDFQKELREKLGERLGQKAQQMAAARASGGSLKREKIVEAKKGKVVGKVGGGKERVRDTGDLQSSKQRLDKAQELKQEAAATDVKELTQEFQEEQGDLEPDPKPEDTIRVVDDRGHATSHEIPASEAQEAREAQGMGGIRESHTQPQYEAAIHEESQTIEQPTSKPEEEAQTLAQPTLDSEEKSHTMKESTSKPKEKSRTTDRKAKKPKSIDLETATKPDRHTKPKGKDQAQREQKPALEAKEVIEPAKKAEKENEEKGWWPFG